MHLLQTTNHSVVITGINVQLMFPFSKCQEISSGNQYFHALYIVWLLKIHKQKNKSKWKMSFKRRKKNEKRKRNQKNPPQIQTQKQSTNHFKINI